MVLKSYTILMICMAIKLICFDLVWFENMKWILSVGLAFIMSTRLTNVYQVTVKSLLTNEYWNVDTYATIFY